MRILGIESSCDETAAAVVADGRRVLSSVVASQAALHRETGGVVPEVAARAHLRALVPVVRRALADAECGWDDLDAVAVTAGPGLPGALVVGLNGARGLAYARGLPLIPVDHIEGHVCANWLSSPLAATGMASMAPGAGASARTAGERTAQGRGAVASEGTAATPTTGAGREMEEPTLPALALVVSGGHTELLLMLDHGRFERLGGTRDDAAGEAFDKVARLLGLPYPGGPPLSRLAAQATQRRLRLPRAWLGAGDDFSFSGLKTAVLHVVQSPSPPPAAEIAWAFEEAVADVLSKKAARAAAREGVASLLLGGGVAANRRLRERVIERSPVPVHIPPPALCTDNAAMIAAAAFRHLDAAVAPESPLDIAPTARRRGRQWA